MTDLLLLRHAKSDWDAAYARDYDRPLNRRGIRSAEAVGEFLAAYGLVPDLVLSSGAVRAATTAHTAAAAGGWRADIREVPELYGAGPEEVLAAVRAQPEAGRLMVVGHNPTMSLAASRLTGGALGMPTAALACLGLPGSPAEAAWGTAELRLYATPRLLLAAAGGGR